MFFKRTLEFLGGPLEGILIHDSPRDTVLSV
jgi:hypothetical protein